MPWTEKQMRLFRAAAHDKGISRKTGIKQSDARRMMNEGVKKAAGGWLKQAVGKKDTKHGLLDLPVAKERTVKKPKMRFAGGGQAEVRKADRFRPSRMPATERGRIMTDASREAFARADEYMDSEDSRRVRGAIVRARDTDKQKAAVSAFDRWDKLLDDEPYQYKKGGVVRCRDGCAVRGKTKGAWR